MSEPPFQSETVIVPAREAPPIDLELEMDAATGRGLYSNLILISHSREDFTLEFAYVQPTNKALVQSRVIMPIGQVRGLVEALAGQLRRHDERFETR